MPVFESPLILWFCGGYLAICLLIGVWALKRTRTSADFFVVGRRLNVFVMVIAANASIVGGFSFIGGPGAVFSSGATSLWLACGLIGGPLAILLVGKRLALLAGVREVLTLPDAVEARYGGRWPRMSMAFAILVGVVGYAGTHLLALGVVLTAVLGVDLPTAMLIGVAVVAFYSIAGGIVAAVYTDLFQGALMVIAALMIFYSAQSVGGGFAAMSTTLWEMDPEFLGSWGKMGPLAALSWYFLAAIGISGQPHVITKYLMLRDVRSLKWAAILSVITYLPLTLIWVSVGLTMRYLVQTGAQAPLESPDLATPLFLLNHVSPAVAGIALAGLLSAIMSSVDAFLNLGAASVVRDIPKALIGRPIRRELMWSRVATAVLLVLAGLFALFVEGLIVFFVTFAAGALAAAIVPSIAIGLNWKRASAAACISSILGSLVLNVGLEVMNRYDFYHLPAGLHVGTFSLVASIVVFVLVSFWNGDPKGRQIPADVMAVMDA